MDYSSDTPGVAYNTTIETISITDNFSLFTEPTEALVSTGVPYIINVIVYVLIGLWGVIGNVLVLLIMLKNANMRKSLFNRLLIHQSLLDGLSAFFVIMYAYVRFDIKLEGRSGDLYCRLMMIKFPMWSTFLASSLNLDIITLERYINLLYPMYYKRSVTSKKVLTIAFVTSAACLVFILIRDYLTSGLDENGFCLSTAKFRSRLEFEAVVLFSVGVQFYIPFLVMFIAYSHIFIYLFRKTREPSIGSNSSSSSTRNDKLQKATQNVLKTMCAVCIIYFLCWVGNSTTFILMAFGVVPPFFSSPWYHFSSYLCFINCAVNPVIYSLQYEEFKEAARVLFGGKKSRRKSIKEMSSSSKSQTTDDLNNSVATTIS